MHRHTIPRSVTFDRDPAAKSVPTPKRYYSAAQLSEKISETPEGYLLCEAVPITRTGDLVYMASETPVTADASGKTIITRTHEDIHNAATIASFEGKPVTINHSDFVGPENWRELSVGIVQNVRAGEGEDSDKLLADLLITDREAISAVKNNKLREVSCGYETDYIEDSPGFGRQTNIIGNHVALVPAGRCGSECAIFDHAPTKEVPIMSVRKKLMSMFQKAVDELLPEGEDKDEKDDKETTKDDDGLSAKLDIIMKRLEGLESSAASTKDEDAKVITAAADVAKAVDTVTLDTDTIARAEILAPGILPSADIRQKAIAAAYSTADGKSIIDSLLCGKTIETVDADMLFVAASEMLKKIRRDQVNNHGTTDTKASDGAMTPEKLNALHAKHYHGK